MPHRLSFAQAAGPIQSLHHLTETVRSAQTKRDRRCISIPRMLSPPILHNSPGLDPTWVPAGFSEAQSEIARIQDPGPRTQGTREQEDKGLIPPPVVPIVCGLSVPNCTMYELYSVRSVPLAGCLSLSQARMSIHSDGSVPGSRPLSAAYSGLPSPKPPYLTFR